MLVCVDTNVMLSALARGSPLAPLFDAITSGRLELALSTAILFEYEEIAQQQGGASFAEKLMRMIALVASVHHTIHFVEPTFEFQTIPADADDNKFANCAIVAHADYVITEDKHFAPLANAGYKPQAILPLEFIERCDRQLM
jgi:putative PIN family toxin of toxin-antitoxin system